MAAAPLSKAELEFTLQALRREGVRIDGRALLACRRLGLRFGAAHGEVEVTFGPTRALAICTGEIVTPPQERPNEGRISFHVEFGPIASPTFEAGRPSVQATAVANLIERLIKGSRAVDAEALCIVGGQKVWSIRVDIRALDDDGNLTDVCCIAALCSLLHFRKSDVEVRGDSANCFSAQERVPVPLSIHHLPVPVTFALFESRGSTGKGSEQATWILDPNRLEEAAMDGALCIAVNQHGELCGVHKPGGMPVDFALIERCKELAVGRAQELTGRIQAELEADLAKRQEARRNVHQAFAQAQLLTVDMATSSVQEPEPAQANGKRRQGWRSRARGAAEEGPAAVQQLSPRQPAVASTALAASMDEDDGRDLDAELAAVAAEAAELEEQLAAAESAELAAVAAAGLVVNDTVAADGSSAAAAPAAARRGRKKRRSK